MKNKRRYDSAANQILQIYMEINPYNAGKKNNTKTTKKTKIQSLSVGEYRYGVVKTLTDYLKKKGWRKKIK